MLKISLCYNLDPPPPPFGPSHPCFFVGEVQFFSLIVARVRKDPPPPRSYRMENGLSARSSALRPPIPPPYRFGGGGGVFSNPDCRHHGLERFIFSFFIFFQWSSKMPWMDSNPHFLLPNSSNFTPWPGIRTRKQSGSPNLFAMNFFMHQKAHKKKLESRGQISISHDLFSFYIFQGSLDQWSLMHKMFKFTKIDIDSTQSKISSSSLPEQCEISFFLSLSAYICCREGPMPYFLGARLFKGEEVVLLCQEHEEGSKFSFCLSGARRASFEYWVRNGFAKCVLGEPKFSLSIHWK